MRRLALLLTAFAVSALSQAQALWPDGSPMDAWFTDRGKVDVRALGARYDVTDYGVVRDSTLVQTALIQAVIDRCAAAGGGVVVIPRGTFLTGALFFRQGTHLHVEGRLKGIDDIRHYPLIQMHMEGKSILYFSALVTAEGLDGFTITGPGTIDGNGRRFWEEFWLRRQYNRSCTNLEALRPQLLYIANSSHVTVQDVSLVNSPFWTNHLYRCNHVKFLDCTVIAPTEGETRAPSSDGIDLDVCDDVVIRGCYVNVCDDGIAVKGGKGVFVDQDTTAGPVQRVLVEGCRFGRRSGGGITFGSEAWSVRNIVMRDCRFEGAAHMLLFKMRPDTPQTFEDVLVEDCAGAVRNVVQVYAWRQFFDATERKDMPESVVRNVTVRRVNADFTECFARIDPSDDYRLENFSLEDPAAPDPLIPVPVRNFDFDLTQPQPAYADDIGYGYDRGSQAVSKDQKAPMFFSVKVPEGDYKVTVTLGNKRYAGSTAVRSETRRMVTEPVETRKGEFRDIVFNVNVHTPRIDGKKTVSLKGNEFTDWGWDDRLTLEFNGDAPAVSRIRIEPNAPARKIWLCGDSTVTDQDNEPYASWGQMLPYWFDERVSVENLAMSGLTTSTFLAQNRLAKIAQEVRPGDIVVVEFGHNDEKDRGPGSGAWYNYSMNLRKFADTLLPLGARVVYATPTQRRFFDGDGRITQTHGDYPEAMRAFCAREGLPFIDMTAQTQEMYETMGVEGSKRLLVHYPAGTWPGQDKALEDNTHNNAFGAFEFSKLVLTGLLREYPELKEYLRPGWKDFSPSAPDDPNAFRWPASPMVQWVKPDGN